MKIEKCPCGAKNLPVQTSSGDLVGLYCPTCGHCAASTNAEDLVRSWNENVFHYKKSLTEAGPKA